MAAALIAGALAYSNVFHVPFLFDDVGNIVENPIIRNFSYFLNPDGAGGFPLYGALRLRYVAYLSFAANYAAGGLEVWGYHAVNVIVHLVNGLLVYCLTALLLQARGETSASASGKHKYIPVLAAALFVCHPIQTQAVTYVVQRMASLATLFYLTSVVLYAKARSYRADEGGLLTTKGWQYYMLSVCSALLAVKTKEISFTLPAAILMYELMIVNDRGKWRVLLVAPFVVAAGLIPLTILQGTQSATELMGALESATRVQTNLSRLDYLATQSVVLITYIRLLFWPFDQNVDYDYPIFNSFLDPRVFASCLILGALVLVAFCLARRAIRRGGATAALTSFGILWFFLTLSVESSVIPIVDVIFEHRLYLPSVGAFIALGTILAAGIERWQRQGPVWVHAAHAVLVAAVALLAVATFARNQVWGDAVRLWEDVARKSPQKERIHNNLGLAYYGQGRWVEAVAQLEEALRIAPGYAEAHLNRGTVLSAMGRIGEAEKAYRLALQFDPGQGQAYNNLGKLYLEQHRVDEAYAAFQQALERRPDLAEAHNNAGTALAEKRLLEPAIAKYREAIRIKPDLVEAYNNLGNALDDLGRLPEAVEQYRKAIALNPTHPVLHYNLAVACDRGGRTGEAVRHYREALRLKPDFAEARLKLDAVLGQR